MQELASANGYLVFDLDDAPSAVCMARQARAVPQDTTLLLARTITYQMATFERKIGGAAAAVNAKPDDRARAVGAFVGEVAPQVERAELFVNPGPGVSAESLRPLRKVDGRHPLFWSDGAALRGLGIAAAAHAAVGLDGRRVVIEGFDDAGDALVQAIDERGGRIVAVSTPKGTAIAAAGLEVEAMLDAHEYHGASFVKELGVEVGLPGAAFGIEADVLIAGSDLGIIDDAVAADLRVGAVVPSGPVPLTAPALARLQQAGAVVVPDFVSTAGALFAMWPEADASIEDVRAAVTSGIADAVAEVLHQEQGPFLGACARAEAFLLSWCSAVPTERPLA